MHLSAAHVLCGRDKGIKTNYSREVLLTRQLNTVPLEILQVPQERADRFFFFFSYLRGDASASQDLGLHSVEPVTFTHSKFYFHSVVWIIVKEKTTVDHKLCIWPSAIKNVNLRCSKEKIKGYKRNLRSILSTEQGKGSVLIHLKRLYTQEANSAEDRAPAWKAKCTGGGAGGEPAWPPPPASLGPWACTEFSPRASPPTMRAFSGTRVY